MKELRIYYFKACECLYLKGYMGFVYNLEFFRIDSGDISLILDERLKEY